MASNSIPLSPVPSLIANRTINLLIGSSSAGKTVLMLSELERYLAYGEFLGAKLPHDQPPLQCGIITRPKSLGTFHAQIAKMALHHCSDPVLMPITDWAPTSGETAIETFARTYHELCHCARQPVRMILVEELQHLMEAAPKSNDMKQIRDFYCNISEFITQHDIAIIGTVGQAKMRQGERYSLLADRIFGSIGWAQGAATMIGIEQIMQHVPEERRPSARRVTIQTPHARARVLYVDFDGEGRLNPITFEEEPQESPLWLKLDAIVAASLPGKEWTRQDLFQWAEELNISERTAARWLASRTHESLGMLEVLGNSTKDRRYRKPLVN